MMNFRKIIDLSVSIIGKAVRGRKVKLQGVDPVKVNLGCGLAIAPGWINVDASLNALFAGAWGWLIKILYKISGSNRYYSEKQYIEILSANRFVFHDLAISLPFEDDSVDVFYSSHFFEHLFKNDASRLIRECFKALRKGGLIRIAVPDLAYAVKQYKEGAKKEMLENYFFVNDLSSYLARHKYMYDFELMRDLLVEGGFEDVRICAYRQGACPDIMVLDNRPEETLFVEAVK